MPTEEDSNLLRAAARRIEKGSTPWGRGTIHGPKGPGGETVACVYGFLVRASSRTWAEAHKKAHDLELEDLCDLDAQKALVAVIKDHYPVRNISPSGIILHWNDKLAVDANEVVSFLEKAAARLEEQAGL